MRGRLAFVAVFLGLSPAVACYTAPEPDCGFVCGSGGACPDDYTCMADNICHRNGSPTDLTCPSGQSFDVLSVTPSDDHHVAVLFDAAPDPTSGADPANYAIAGLTITAAAVNGATVTLTTSTQTPITYTLVAANILRASDGAALTNDTATFTGIAAFDVASAMSVDATTLAITFDAAPDMTQATTLASYAITPTLAVSGTPTLAGSTVTLTTDTQAAVEYTVTVTGVTRATDHEPLDTNTAMFPGRNVFLVASAASISHTSITVTFSAPPDPTAATTLSNYNAGSLALSGTPVLAGSVVTITTASQAATSYTVTVSNVTRAGDGQALTPTGRSASFTGRTAFNVTGAASVSNTSLAVTFSDPPDPMAAVTLANYNAGGLVLSGTPVLAGNTVTITSASQTATSYTVTVSNITRAIDTEALGISTAMFTGRTPFLVVSAAAPDASDLTVTFSDPPTSSSAAMVGNFASDGGLTFTMDNGATGNSVQLVTSTQTLGMPYTLTVSNITRASDGEGLDGTMVMWPGVSCGDGANDDGETDVDCGGGVCAPCPLNDMCVLDRDCVSGTCSGNVCQ
ncbi:MAG TPA: hypothetical protein VMJ10_01360 [Kofleriaceae bacterium]|nr:hypothetical protein [Kofleriaceae bacterium]